MGSLQRSVSKLGARRQRHIITGSRPLLSQQLLTDNGVAAATAAFVLALLFAMGLDAIVAALRQATALLNTMQLIGIGSIGASAALIGRRVIGRPITLPTQPRRLAAALKHELDVSGDRRAHVEHLSITALAAYWLVAQGQRPRLLLQTEDAWITFEPPLLPDGPSTPPTTHQRWLLERLRWTHAILSVAGHGPQIETSILKVPLEALGSAASCEVRQRNELPTAIQAALPSAPTGYRR